MALTVSGLFLAVGSEAEAQAEPAAEIPEVVVSAVEASDERLPGVVAGRSVLLRWQESGLPDGMEKPDLKARLLPLPDGASGESDEGEGTEDADAEQFVEVQSLSEKGVVVNIPEDLKAGLFKPKLYEIQLFHNDEAQSQAHWLKVYRPGTLILRSLIPIAVVVVIVAFVIGAHRRTQRRKGISSKTGPIKVLFMESDNQTYSLSRAQFILWTLAIAWAYVFLFFTRALVIGEFRFPPLGGFAITFLISLGTLLTAQATKGVKGSKGAGSLEPHPSDLFMHGGVLALERVQQALWTAIALFMFVWIVYANSTALKLPEIPPELLYLMGISSGGYVAGKMIRKPGPVIERIKAEKGSVKLSIAGGHLSTHARVLLDGNVLEEPAVAKEFDPSAPDEFARRIEVTVPENIAKDINSWQSQERRVTVMNADSQRAEWHSSPKIVSVEESAKPANNEEKTATLTVQTEHVAANAIWTVDGQVPEEATATLDDPNKWELRIKGGPTDYQEIIVENQSRLGSPAVYKRTA